MNNIIPFLLPGLVSAVIAYLLGSISFSIIFTRLLANHQDIRTMGSGNAGMTNVLRSVGKLAAFLTFICDFAKGALAVLIARTIFQYVCTANGFPLSWAQYGTYLAGLAAILGHSYPIYFGFRGGKGVLTTAAMMLVLDWRVFLCTLVVFAIVFLCSKIVSLSSIIGAAAYPIFTILVLYFLDYRQGEITVGGMIFGFITAAVIGGIVIAKHKSNIIRLKHGEEKKITASMKKQS